MPDNETRLPDNTETASQADAGDEMRQLDESVAMHEAKADHSADYDAREASISVVRKDMGPPFEETGVKAMEETQAEEDQYEEPPVDPA